MTSEIHDLAFLRLPINADEGFPQSFRLRLGAAAYTFTLTVTILDESLLHTGEPLRLPQPGAYMVAAVTRDAPGTPRVVLRRRLVQGHVYSAEELALTFTELRVDPRNLNAVGSFGSMVVGGVVNRWAS